jgi:hypothetical protein
VQIECGDGQNDQVTHEHDESAGGRNERLWSPTFAFSSIPDSGVRALPPTAMKNVATAEPN